MLTLSDSLWLITSSVLGEPANMRVSQACECATVRSLPCMRVCVFVKNGDILCMQVCLCVKKRGGGSPWLQSCICRCGPPPRLSATGAADSTQARRCLSSAGSSAVAYSLLSSLWGGKRDILLKHTVKTAKSSAAKNKKVQNWRGSWRNANNRAVKDSY